MSWLPKLLEYFMPLIRTERFNKDRVTLRTGNIIITSLYIISLGLTLNELKMAKSSAPKRLRLLHLETSYEIYMGISDA